MHSYPHHYATTASARSEGDVLLESRGSPSLSTAAPEQFGGPGDRWSPETLCAGAVADCFILTFRAIARAAKIPWSALRCDVVGTLDRVGGTARFTHFSLHATLDVPDDVDETAARSALERAERGCLISNSLKGSSHLEIEIHRAAASP
jgi:organic hydroperoxide reductase OsmC/OhrA